MTTDDSLQFCGWLIAFLIFKGTYPYQSVQSSSIKFNCLILCILLESRFHIVKISSPTEPFNGN
jgi:hypothetical protein